MSINPMTFASYLILQFLLFFYLSSILNISHGFDNGEDKYISRSKIQYLGCDFIVYVIQSEAKN